MKQYIPWVILVLCIAFGVWDRCTSNDTITVRLNALNDSLTVSQAREERLRETAVSLRLQANTVQQVKVVTRTIYRKDTTNNHRLTLLQKDSAVKARLLGDLLDSSRLTGPLATRILDMQSENTMLRVNAHVDSMAIAGLDSAFQTLDSAYRECGYQKAMLKQQGDLRVKRERRRALPWKIAAVVGWALVVLL